MVFFWARMPFPADIREPNYDAAYDKWLLEYFDGDIETWGMYCENPEADEPVWSEPRAMFPYAVMRNKSATLKNGTWFLTVYLPKCADKYRYYLSPDCGETFEFHEGAKKLSECEYPEPMVVERKDGSLDFYARTYTSRIAKSVSADGGNT